MQALQQFAATAAQEVQFVTDFCVPMPCPGNGVDCGMFTVGFAAAMMLDIGVDSIVQSKMAQYRQTWPQQLRRAGNLGMREVLSPKLLGA